MIFHSFEPAHPHPLHPLRASLPLRQLIHRTPPTQYKPTHGAPGIEDGAEVSKRVYDKYYEIYKIYQLLNATKL